MQLKQLNKDFSSLCSPARFYLVTSVISLLLLLPCSSVEELLLFVVDSLFPIVYTVI